MNVIEFHTLNETKNALGKPGRMIFDLDPGEEVKWSFMQEAAQIVRIFLNELQLVSFLKTSGGKGVHVVVPIKRLRDWDTVKDFSQAIVEHLAKTIPPVLLQKAAQAIAWDGFLLTTCEMVLGQPLHQHGPLVPAQVWVCPCRWHGKNWGRSPARPDGQLPISRIAWIRGTAHGLTMRLHGDP